MTARANQMSKFLNLVERVHACRKCPRMNGSARVLGMGCGPLDASLVFVGEAPGRLGADASNLPFHGDKAGNNFESLIDRVGISRYHVFVTNAVLCNPRDEAGNNATPSPAEVSNCAPFLREQIELLEPKLVVTLGAVALRACSIVQPHALTLGRSVRTTNKWFGRKLVPVYHPGQRAMVHRSYSNQLADYQFVAELLKRGDKKMNRRSTVRKSSGDRVAHVARRILEQRPEGISYFALHKLYFLSEVAHLEAVGERLSNAYVVRQKDGPYCVELHASKLTRMIPGIIVRTLNTEIRLSLNPQRAFDDVGVTSDLTEVELASIDRTVSRYGGLSNAELKRVSYLSSPMRTLLRKEQRSRTSLFNSIVLPYKPTRALP